MESELKFTDNAFSCESFTAAVGSVVATEVFAPFSLHEDRNKLIAMINSKDLVFIIIEFEAVKLKNKNSSQALNICLK